ncbi:uncharacterized protein LOC119642264 [Glossina fuscipes]|uniref:Uncharacterized protein LOC119642264 n=1 Tax=Glossina fuscipes TaxID=7396 RepID=A0A9C5ZES3_9MUSC|nr:uncharacterized protein LOC119642264 [Glossina fuscipes]KAI9576698.1 hypothetical protein GQX74_010680 [Glossina fuscipes]
MEVGRVQPVSAVCSRPPTYEQSCGFKQNSFCASFFNDALKDPVLIFITIAVVIGSFCLLSGLFLLCLVSKAIQDETSEAILLIGIGIFISCIAGISWKLTNKRQMSQFIDSIGAQGL